MKDAFTQEGGEPQALKRGWGLVTQTARVELVPFTRFGGPSARESGGGGAVVLMGSGDPREIPRFV